MLLNPDRADHFHYLYQRLLAFANHQLEIITRITGNLTASELADIRDGLLDNPRLIDEFIKTNPYKFTKDDLNTIAGWQHCIRSQFHIVKQLKDYAIFLSEEKPMRAYGVVGINDTIESMTHRTLPMVVQTILLPFDGKIIHDGLMRIYPIVFGSGLRKELNAEYEAAKSRFGIITSLPFEGGENERSNADLLRFYLKSEDNRERYWEKIWNLIEKDPGLLTIYHQEMGRFHARTLRKQLKKSQVMRAWFAILEGTIIASGQTEHEAREAAWRIVPEDRQSFIYIFQYKG